MDRFESLLSEDLDGKLDALGERALAQRASADPSLLAEIAELVREDRILEVDLGVPLGPEFTRSVIADLDKDKTRFVRSVMTDISRKPPRRRRRSFRPRRRPGLPGGLGPFWVCWSLPALALFLGSLAFPGSDRSPDPRRLPSQANLEFQNPRPRPTSSAFGEERSSVTPPQRPT